MVLKDLGNTLDPLRPVSEPKQKSPVKSCKKHLLVDPGKRKKRISQIGNSIQVTDYQITYCFYRQ